MKKFSDNIKIGDIVNIWEQEPDGSYRPSKIYYSPCIFIDHSVPWHTNDNEQYEHWYKVFLLFEGRFEWFDKPYWRINKL